MIIQRIEHPISGKGPFTHFENCVQTGMRIVDAIYMEEIDNIPPVSNYIRTGKVRFGFTLSRKLPLDIIKDCGFVVRTFTVEPLYVHHFDEQVAYLQ